MTYREVKQLTFREVRQLAEEWADEFETNPYDDWCHPFTNVTLSVTQVLWSLHTERKMSVRGMRLHFERHMDAVMQRSERPERPL